MFPRRRLYIVRHAEREDNLRSSTEGKRLYGDNSPLSERGLLQSEDLRNYFENITINSIYSSPYERTMQTASILLGTKKNLINVEPGLCEVLYMCSNPPGFLGLKNLSERFSRVNMYYQPVYTPERLPRREYGDEACCDRVKNTLEKILETDPRSENIVIVSHGAPIAALHSVLDYDFTYVGQATISIFEETASGSHKFRCLCSSDKSHLSRGNDVNLRPY